MHGKNSPLVPNTTILVLKIIFSSCNIISAQYYFDTKEQWDVSRHSTTPTCHVEQIAYILSGSNRWRRCACGCSCHVVRDWRRRWSHIANTIHGTPTTIHPAPTYTHAYAPCRVCQLASNRNTAPPTTALLKCQRWPQKQLVSYRTVTMHQKLKVPISRLRTISFL